MLSTVVAREFVTDRAARAAWETLLSRTRGASSLYRFSLDGHYCVAVVADDAAALAEAQRAWPGGEPVQLPTGVVEQLRARRATQAPTRRGQTRVRRASALRAPPSIGPRLIAGCVLADEPAARALYEQMVERLLPHLQGALLVFAEVEGWVVAAVADDATSARLAQAALLACGGNLDWQPSDERVAELLALRAEAGQAPFPVSYEGEARVGAPLTSADIERTAVHPPTRRQPCVCGSGRRYKNCCGRGR